MCGKEGPVVFPDWQLSTDNFQEDNESHDLKWSIKIKKLCFWENII